MGRFVTTGVVAAAIGTLACGATDPQVGHLFDVETIDGVDVATNRVGPRFSEPLFALDEQLTLAQDPSNEESLLFRPRDFARGGDGNYYVADAGNGRIAVFDETGAFLHSIGRAGQGPGEFSDSFGLVAPFDVEIQAFDSSAQRTQRFSFDGTLLGGVTAPTEGRLESLLQEADGTVVLTKSAGDVVDELLYGVTIMGVIPPGSEAPLAEISTSGTPTMVQSLIETAEFTAVVMVQIPFSAAPGVVRHGSGVIVVNGDSGEVEWRDADGTLRRTATVERDPIPVTDAMREKFADKFAAARARDADEGRSFPAPMPDLWYPEVSGWWREPRIDDAGYLWLQDAASATLGVRGDDTRYEILSPEGEYLGHVMLPFTDFRVQDGTILARDTDPITDEVRLRVFRLRPIAPDFTYPESVS